MISSFAVSLPHTIFFVNCLSVTVTESASVDYKPKVYRQPRNLPVIWVFLSTGVKIKGKKRTFSLEREIS